MVAYKDFDPLFSASQLLAQANGFFGQTWNPTNELNYNEMAAKGAQYDQLQRQNDYQQALQDEMSQGGSPEDIFGRAAKVAQEYGQVSQYEKALQDQEEEGIRNKIKALPEDMDLTDRVNELQKMYIESGDLDKAIKLRPQQNESKFFSYRGGITAVDPVTGEVKVLREPMAPTAQERGSAPKFARFMIPETGEVITPNLNDPRELAAIPPNAINMGKSDNPLVMTQIEAALENAKKLKAPAPKSPEVVTGNEGGGGLGIEDLYNRFMPKKRTLMKRRVE